MSNHYDVIVIGAGPGGYVCAIRAAQLGMKVACVEKRASLGGTCLNIGCIPSKALLSASEKYEGAKHHYAHMGIKSETTLDLKAMMGFKDEVVEANTKGIDFLFKKNKIDRLLGHGEIISKGQVKVSPLTPPQAEGKTAEQSGGEVYTADYIVIATGSDVISLPGIAIDEDKIVSSTGALELKAVPKTMAVIGGGVIGLEMGTVWRRLGASVTVIEYLDNILPGMDEEIRKESLKIFKKQGLNFKLASKVTSAKTTAKGVDLSIEPAAGGAAENLSVDVVLMAIGRKPYLEGLGLQNVGVALDERGRVKVNEYFETSVEGIFAIGDVIAGPMLAHKAEDEGVILAEILAGESGHIDYNLIPGVVYTWPEIANVGQTEEQLKKAGVEYRSGKFPFMANGRARAMGMTDGFAKILADANTDRILGAHIIGPEAGTLIAEIVLAMECDMTAEDIFRSSHAHPTLSEVVKEAALAVHKRPIHV
jgi:dihydrolipoamide dehydrogenase